MWECGLQGKDILVEKASQSGSSVDELKGRSGTNKADDVAQGDEASIVALRHNVALVPLKQLLGRHGGRCLEEQREAAATRLTKSKDLGGRQRLLG